MVKKNQYAFDRLKKAIIKWGYECNNDCIFCHSAGFRKEKSLSRDEIIKKVDSARRLGTKILLFSGGEPLLIKDLEEIIRYTFSKKMYSGLITNGRLLADRERLRRLYSLGLRYVYMSLVSLNQKTYRKITGLPGLNQSLQAVANMLNISSLMLTVNIPVIKQNIDEVVDTACKLALIGNGRIIIKLSVTEPKGNALANFDDVVIPLSKSASVIAEGIREAEKVNPDTLIFHDGLPVCLSPDYEKYNRDMYSENILYMSEAFEKRFFRVDYKNMDYVRDICSLCTAKNRCKGIYKEYIRTNDIPLTPIGREESRSKKRFQAVPLNTEKNYEVNIGKLCNNSCIFCANGLVSKEENRFTEFEKIREEIQKAYNDGFRSLGFLGGEITIHPDVIRIIEYAKGIGFTRIALCTNGRRLSDLSFAKKIVNAGATRFMISIHSHREETENYLNGRKNAFKEKIQGIKNLIDIDSKRRIEHGISLNTCIHSLNHTELDRFIIFFSDLGIRDFRFNFIRPENKSQYDRKIIPRLSDTKESIRRLINYCEKNDKISIAIGDIPFCLLPDILIRNRELLKKYIGELRDLDTFVTTFASRTDPDFVDRFSWRERKSNFLKTKSPVCKKCVFDSVCEGLFRNYINLYGIKELRPVKVLWD